MLSFTAIHTADNTAGEVTGGRIHFRTTGVAVILICRCTLVERIDPCRLCPKRSSNYRLNCFADAKTSYELAVLGICRWCKLLEPLDPCRLCPNNEGNCFFNGIRLPLEYIMVQYLICVRYQLLVLLGEL